jgi:5-methylcytosine-specific restriction endonuclease McrA
VLVSSTPAVRKKATDDEIEAAAQRRARGEPPLVPPSTLWAWLSFRRRDPLRQITDAERNRVWVEHGPRCAYCHRVTIRGGKRHERYEADHIKPHSLGGHSSPMLNICVSCGRCNGKKGNSYGLQSRLVAHELKKWATRPVPVPASNQFGEY